MRSASNIPSLALALLEAAPDAIVIAGEDGRILLANAQAERLFGWTREELVGQAVEVLVPERFRAGHPAQRRVYTKEPRVRPMGAGGVQLFGLRRDGTEFPADISLSPLDAEGGRLAITAVRDATERLRGEEERVRLAQAQEAVRVRDEFLSIAAHELRTPLTALTLRLEALFAAHRAESRFAEPLDRALRQARRLARLLDMLLDLSRVAAGKVSLEREPEDLSRLTAEMVDAHVEQARAAGSPISLDLPPSLPCVIDRARIEQVVANLLSNAVKYGAGRPIEVALHQRDGRAELVVRDHGIGIAPADRARIFDKFERVARRHTGGFGLGLYVSRNLVEAHGGTIHVESAPDQGSTFTVSLPLAQPG